MTIDEHQIREARFDGLQYVSHDCRHFLSARRILGRNMAAVNHRRWAGMQANAVSKILRSLSDVLEHKLVDIATSAAKQTDNIQCPVRAFDISPLHVRPPGFLSSAAQ